MLSLKKKKKMKIHKIKKIFLIVISSLLIIIGTNHFFFLFLAGKLLKKPIIKIVEQKTNNLYTFEYDELKINLISHSFYLKNFKLIPNLKTDSTNLLSLELKEFEIKNLKLFPLFFKKAFIVKTIKFYEPNFKFTKRNPKLNIKSSEPISYEIIKQQILSHLLPIFNSIEIKQFIINSGKLSFLEKLKSQNFTAEKISIIINNFHINKHSFEDKSLFAEDFKIIMNKYKIDLNQWQKLKTDKLIINSKTKSIKLLNSTIQTNKLNDTAINIIGNIKLIKLNGIDFSDIYLNNNLIVKKIELIEPQLIVYNLKHNTNKQVTKNQDLINITKKFFNLININKLLLENGQIKIFATNKSNIPLLNIYGANLQIDKFVIDSSSLSFKNSIENIKTHISALTTITLNKTHILGLKKLYFDYKRHEINISQLTLLPIANFNTSTSLYSIQLNNIILKNFSYNYPLDNNINLGDLSVENGNTKITILQKQKNSSKPQFSLKLDHLNIGKLKLNLTNTQSQQNLKTNLSIFGSNLNLTANTKKIKYNNLKINFTNFSLSSPNNLQNIKLDTLNISTRTKSILIKSLQIIPNTNADSLLKVQHKSLLLNIFVPSLKINNFDIEKAIHSKELQAQSLLLYSPQIDIISFPELETDSFKIKIRKIIREKAISYITNHSSYTIFNMYQTITSFSPEIYKDFKHRSDLIDSLVNIAYNIIYSIYIPNSHIKLHDTSAKNINKLVNITTYNIYDIAFGSNPDSSFLVSYNKLIEIKQNYNRKFINLKEIGYELIKNLNLIHISDIVLDKANLSLSQNITNQQTRVFKNQLSLHINNFLIDKNFTQTCSNKLLCSDYINIDINKYLIHLPDSIHTLELNHLSINTNDSSIFISDIYIHSDTTKPQAKNKSFFLSAYIPNIVLNKISIHKFIDSNILEINKVYTNKSFIHIKTKNLSKKTNNLYTTPKDFFIKKLFINNLITPNNSIIFNSNNFNLYTNANIYLKKISLDTALNLKSFLNNTLINSDLNNTSISFSNNKLEIEKFFINNKGKIWTKNFVFNQNDSLNFSIDSFFINKINLFSLLQEKKLNIDYFYLNKPLIKILKQQKRQQKSITNIDIYKLIYPHLKVITIDTASVVNLQVYTSSFNIKNLYLNIKQLQIDSTSKIDTPNLFYCKNLTFNIKDYSKTLSNFYIIGFSSLQGDISSKQLNINNFYYNPTVTTQQFDSLITWRKTYTKFNSKKIQLNKIDWLQIINKQSIKTTLIKIQDYYIYAYINRGIKHNYSNIKPHFIDLILKSSIPLNINKIFLQNGKIIYQEKSPDNSKPGQIEITKTYIVISNVKTKLNTNEQVKLNMNGLLQNQGKLYINGQFLPDTINYKFHLYGKLTNMDLKVLNSFLIYSVNLKIKSGYLENSEFLINGTDSIATGVFKASYNNLIVEVLKPTGEIQPQKRKFLTFAANIIARRSNPQFGLFYKLGLIAYIHDRSFSDFKFWIKAIVSGVKSLVLFENKKQVKKIYRLRYGTKSIFYF